MSIRDYLETPPLREIVKYDPHPDFKKDSVAFLGAPKKHPYDDEKLLLIQQPLSSDTVLYEFLIDDIVGVEEQPSLGTDTGTSVGMARIWVKKGSLGIQYQPFEVDRPLKYFTDSEVLSQALSESR